MTHISKQITLCSAAFVLLISSLCFCLIGCSEKAVPVENLAEQVETFLTDTENLSVTYANSYSKEKIKTQPNIDAVIVKSKTSGDVQGVTIYFQSKLSNGKYANQLDSPKFDFSSAFKNNGFSKTIEWKNLSTEIKQQIESANPYSKEISCSYCATTKQLIYKPTACTAYGIVQDCIVINNVENPTAK